MQAVDGVDFDLPRNEAMVIIGESGCGKTSLAKAILRLLPRNVETYSGQVLLNGEDLMAPERRGVPAGDPLGADVDGAPGGHERPEPGA